VVVRRSARDDPLALDEEDILVTFGLVGRVTLGARWWHFKLMRRSVDLDLLNLHIYLAGDVDVWRDALPLQRECTSGELGLVQPSSSPCLSLAWLRASYFDCLPARWNHQLPILRLESLVDTNSGSTLEILLLHFSSSSSLTFLILSTFPNYSSTPLKMFIARSEYG
jgi:hypothetical protein